jgi:glycosyltransferase involved in cell wall biosynthesis
MRVLALCSYPREAAATRFRVEQFVRLLGRKGIEVEMRPFLDSGQFAALYQGGGMTGKVGGMVKPVLKRLGGIMGTRGYDVLFVQREAMIFGPAVFEWLYMNLGGVPMVLDLDDATYVHYVSPTYGRLGTALKFFGKTDALIRRAAVVTCGNRFIAEYVKSRGAPAVVVPTVVNLDVFRPREERAEARTLNIGWIGTHSTFPFLESIFPVLERLAEKHRFILKIVGAGRPDIKIKGLEVENLEWNLARETEDFRSLDIGLYPVTVSASANPEWIKGKSGFKAVQYMAVGVPFVMSPVGVCAEMGEPGTTHFNAETETDWYNSLDSLLSDVGMRARMGAAGRQYALKNFELERQADLLADTFERVAKERKRTSGR